MKTVTSRIIICIVACMMLGIIGLPAMANMHLDSVPGMSTQVPSISIGSVPGMYVDSVPGMSTQVPSMSIGSVPGMYVDSVPGMSTQVPSMSIGSVPGMYVDSLPGMSTQVPSMSIDSLPGMYVDSLQVPDYTADVPLVIPKIPPLPNRNTPPKFGGKITSANNFIPKITDTSGISKVVLSPGIESASDFSRRAQQPGDIVQRGVNGIVVFRGGDLGVMDSYNKQGRLTGQWDRETGFHWWTEKDGSISSYDDKTGIERNTKNGVTTAKDNKNPAGLIVDTDSNTGEQTIFYGDYVQKREKDGTTTLSGGDIGGTITYNKDGTIDAKWNDGSSSHSESNQDSHVIVTNTNADGSKTVIDTKTGEKKYYDAQGNEISREEGERRDQEEKDRKEAEAKAKESDQGTSSQTQDDEDEDYTDTPTGTCTGSDCGDMPNPDDTSGDNNPHISQLFNSAHWSVSNGIVNRLNTASTHMQANPEGGGPVNPNVKTWSNTAGLVTNLNTASTHMQANPEGGGPVNPHVKTGSNTAGLVTNLNTASTHMQANPEGGGPVNPHVKTGFSSNTIANNPGFGQGIAFSQSLIQQITQDTQSSANGDTI